jgi:two-component system NtrC family sensor kinase
VRPSSVPDDRHLVLVVDDNRRLRQFVAQSLAAEFRVAEAEDGREALALLERETPAVVVSDVMMPGVDGRALLAAIRSDPRLKTLPVVLLTAHGDADARNDALESGASDYLSKPFSVRELRARVRNLDALRSAQVELSATADALRHSLAETQTAQGRALRAEKLAAIGQVASGIAHEVKNPINFVLNFARPSRARLERIATQLARSADSAALVRDVAAVQEALGRVVEGAERVVGIVDGLQAFARGGGARVQVDVDAEVMAVARLAGPSLRDGVKLETTLGAVGTVLGSPVGVGAVLMNLLTNALYAVGAQGCVRILTHATTSHVTIEVIDDGPGVPEHLRARIFDPFFTTRTAGEGLGLGLALVQRIIHDDLGGTIEVMDAADGGARFRVCLPRRGTAGETGWVDVAP